MHNICIYAYIYIYIISLSLYIYIYINNISLSLSIYIYIYILLNKANYVHISLHWAQAQRPTCWTKPYKSNYKHNCLYLVLQSGGLSDIKLQELILSLRNRHVHKCDYLFCKQILYATIVDDYYISQLIFILCTNNAIPAPGRRRPPAGRDRLAEETARPDLRSSETGIIITTV